MLTFLSNRIYYIILYNHCNKELCTNKLNKFSSQKYWKSYGCYQLGVDPTQSHSLYLAIENPLHCLLFFQLQTNNFLGNLVKHITATVLASYNVWCPGIPLPADMHSTSVLWLCLKQKKS